MLWKTPAVGIPESMWKSEGKGENVEEARGSVEGCGEYGKLRKMWQRVFS